MGAALGVMIGRTVTWHGRNFYASPMLLPHGGTGIAITLPSVNAQCCNAHDPLNIQH